MTTRSRASSIATLFPGYFALVMATGIIAIAAEQQRITWLADTLYLLSVAAYATLLVLVVIRLIGFTDLLVADLTSHAKGFAFLTIVAGTNVLGSASALIHGWWTLSEILWWTSLPIYVLLVYSSLISDVLRHDKPGLGTGINGSWFLLTVSTESIAALGALLLAHDPNDLLAFVCLAAFCLGLVLYLIVMTMVFLRWTFQPLEPTEADPPAWIAAGAVAITVLAGSNLLAARAVSPRIDRLAPLIEGLVTLAWATATFWFPLMVAIGVWRHRPQDPAPLSPLLLGSRLPPRYVRGRHIQDARCRPTRTTRMGPEDHPRSRTHRVDRDVSRPRRTSRARRRPTRPSDTDDARTSLTTCTGCRLAMRTPFPFVP